MADLKDVVDELKQVTAMIGTMKAELAGLRQQQSQADKSSPTYRAETAARRIHMEDIGSEMLVQQKSVHALRQQKESLEDKQEEQKERHEEQRTAGKNLLAHLPQGFRSMASRLGNLTQAMPGLKSILGTEAGSGGIMTAIKTVLPSFLGGGAAAGGAAGAAVAGGAATGGAGIMGALGAATALGPVGLAVAAVAAVGVAMVALPGMITDWGQSLLDSQRHLQNFSGSMAMVFAQSEWRDRERNFRIADATAGSTGGLSRSMSDLNDAWEPITVLLTDVKNLLATGLVNVTTPIVEFLGEISKDLLALLRIVGLATEETHENILMSDWLEETAGAQRGSVFSREAAPKGSPTTDLGQFAHNFRGALTGDFWRNFMRGLEVISGNAS